MNTTTTILITALLGQIPDQSPINLLDQTIFRQHIVELCGHGSRAWDQPGNAIALNYIESQLISYGYAPVREQFSLDGSTSENLYADLSGTNPESHMIIGAHMDSFLSDVSAGADDNASGVSAVLEIARVFASLEPRIGIRFVFFNADANNGLSGSSAYVNQHISEAASWLAMINFDTILYDHRYADMDVEFGSFNFYYLIEDFITRLVAYRDLIRSISYSNSLCCTSSVAFDEYTAVMSIGERIQWNLYLNPYFDSANDVPSSYTDQDYDFGFEILKMATGAIIEMTDAIPQLETATWPEFVECLGSENCLQYDLTGDGKVNLLDISVFTR